MSILPVVVLYNVDYRETNVFRTFLSHFPDMRVVLYENSPEPLNCSYKDDINICYYHDINNGGVSAAYNYGAVKAREFGNIDALLLLDEDTKFHPDYIKQLNNALVANPDICLFVPQVLYSGNQPFSPIHRGVRKNRGAVLEKGIYSLMKYLPVNSGACIRLSAFEGVGGYNSDIRLDFADFDFFSRLAEVSENFYVLGTKAFQSFSNEESQSDKLLSRYRFYIEGAKVARRNKLISMMVVTEVFRHTLALTLRTRSLAFYKVLFHNIR